MKDYFHEEHYINAFGVNIRLYEHRQVVVPNFDNKVLRR